MSKKEYTLAEALFGVELADVHVNAPFDGMLFDTGERKVRRVPGFKAVVAQDNGDVFAIVTKNYNLITNRTALELGRLCFTEVFTGTNSKMMKLFNIIMPETRSFCHFDFLHEGAKFCPFKSDSWQPYLRITNSYNRTFALNFDLGFCRNICKNGVIFGKKNIEFKFLHTRRTADPAVQFKLRAGELSALEAQFTEALFNLKRFHVPRKVMWALVCKVFAQSLPTEPTKVQQALLDEKKETIKYLTNEYFQSLGENGYAALNVLTDFASRPVGMISAEQRIDSLQRQTGTWIGEFITAIDRRDFTFEAYLGKYAALLA
jgi:hypothetical protein